MWNIKALALTVQKLLARLKFQRGGQNDRMTELQNDRITEWQNDRQDKNNMPPDLRSRGHKKTYTEVKCNFHIEVILTQCHLPVLFSSVVPINSVNFTLTNFNIQRDLPKALEILSAFSIFKQDKTELWSAKKYIIRGPFNKYVDNVAVGLKMFSKNQV